MTAFHRLLARLGLTRRDNDAPNAQRRAAATLLRDVHSSTDAEALALRAAVDDGAKGAAALSGVEQQLTGAYDSLRTRTEALFTPTLAALDARLSQLLARVSPECLDAVARACSVEHARLRAQACAPLVALRRVERHALRTLRAFRLHHHRTCEARFPDSRSVHYSALAFVCVLEALANTAAFAEGSDIGLAGGFLTGVMVAATNVAFAFFAGRAATGLFHRRFSLKALSALVVGAWIAFEGAFALAVAHYRIALVTSVDSAPAMALESLLTLPFALHDLLSVLLTVFTAAFGLAALLTGLATDDRYPGYGATTRAWSRARTQLESLRSHTLAALDALFLPAPERLRALTQEAGSVHDAFHHTVDTLKRTAATLEHALNEVEAAHRAARLRARAAFARVTGLPVTLLEPEPLGASTLLRDTRAAITAANAELRAFPTRLARLERERAATEARIQHEHEQALAALPAFFALTEALAEHESDHDETDTAHALARQRALWETEMEDSGPAAPEPLRNDAPGDAAEDEHPAAATARKGNGADRSGQERAA